MTRTEDSIFNELHEYLKDLPQASGWQVAELIARANALYAELTRLAKCSQQK